MEAIRTKQHNRDAAGRLLGTAILIALAALVFFGLHPHYRPFALVPLAAAALCLFKRSWWWWLTCLGLLAFTAALWMLGPAGYRYASIVPLTLTVLVLALRFAGKGLLIAVVSLLLVGAMALGLVEAPILSAAVSDESADADYVIVLGAAVYGTEPSISLQRRIERAIAYLGAHPKAKAVVSGGQGEGEDVSEAACMRDYMIARGVDPDRILVENHSTSTMENLTYSKAVIESDGGSAARVAIVSSSYHLYRAKSMAASLGMQAYGLASSDGYPVYMCGMFIREALGVVKLWLFGAWEREACLASVYAAVR